MAQVLYHATTSRRSLAACVPPRKETTKEIQERSLKHIAEITTKKNLAPPQAEALTYEQQEWLEFRMARPFPKPYRKFAPMIWPYRWDDRGEEDLQ